MSKHSNQFEVYWDFALSRAPILLKMNGKGAETVMIPAKSAVAPSVPNLSYICPANSGKAAAKDDRTKAFADNEEAAMGRYAATR